MENKIKIGDIVTVRITGIKPFGAFGQLPDGRAGLIHISEISDKFVSSVDNFVHNGEMVKVKVIDFDKESNHAKLSLKALDGASRRKEKNTFYKNPRHSIRETPKGFKPLETALKGWIKIGITEEENHD